jgi:hypothetical protein
MTNHQSEAARDAAAAARVARNSIANSSRGAQSEAARDAAAARAANPPPKSIQVRENTVISPDGSRVTTINIDVRANVTVNSQYQNHQIDPAFAAYQVQNGIERAFTRSYAVNERNITHYVTTAYVTNQLNAPERMRFDFVNPSALTQADGTVAGGRADVANNRVQMNNSREANRITDYVAAHEFGHMAGLPHTNSPGRSMTDGNLMDPAAPSRPHLERSQLDSIRNNPAFQ